jgi:hypothetical protein
MILYLLAILNKANFYEYALNLVTFNITFSLGLGAIIVAAMTLIQKGQTKYLKPQIIKFINEFVAFILLNFLLLLVSQTKIIWLIHIFIMLTFASTLTIIYGSRGFLKIFLEKLQP